MANFKVSTDYEDYSEIVEKATVYLDEKVYIIITPIEKTTTENNITTIELLLECKFVDDDNAYSHTWLMNRMELKQFIKLFQDIQLQLQAKLNKDNSNTGCTRSISYK